MLKPCTAEKFFGGANRYTPITERWE